MSTFIILEAEELKNIIDSSLYHDIQYTYINSKGLEGEIVQNAALITLTATTINTVAKVIIELIKNRRKPKITYKGNGIELETEDTSASEVKTILSKLIGD